MRTLWFLIALAVPAAAAPNAAFVRDTGVAKIDDAGKVTRLLADKDLITSIAVDADGDVWAGAVSGKLTAFKKKKKVTAQLPGKDNKAPVAMIAAKGGGLWVLGREHLSHVSARGVVKKHPIPVERVQGSASLLETGDVLWLASDYGLHKFAGGKWEQVRPNGHEHLARDTANVMWTVQRTKGKPDVLARFDGTKWSEVAIDGEGVSALAAGKDGRLYVLLWSSKWKQSRVDVLTNAKWSAKRLIEGAGSLAVDDGERLWVRADDGVAVYAKDGKRVAHFAAGTVAGIAGGVRELVVTGAGPTTLPAIGAVVKGTIKGKLMKSAKEPLANTKFKLCSSSDCSGSGVVDGATGADGSFQLEAAQIEYTTLKLQQLHMSLSSITKCCLQLAAGKPLDLKTIVLPATN